MENLINHIKGKDVFENESVIDELIIQEYFMRNERKKEDDKWLKKHKPTVFKGLQALGKDKADFGDIRVSYTIPDQSHFDEVKVLEYALEKGVYEQITKPVLDEDALMTMIEQGLIDFDELKDRAWVEKLGTERVLVKKVKRNEEE